jgi:hypothetical protein
MIGISGFRESSIKTRIETQKPYPPANMTIEVSERVPLKQGLKLE